MHLSSYNMHCVIDLEWTMSMGHEKKIKKIYYTQILFTCIGNIERRLMEIGNGSKNWKSIYVSDENK